VLGCLCALVLGFLGGRQTERQQHEALGKGAEELLEKSRIEAEAVRDRRLLEAEREAAEIRKKAEEQSNASREALQASREELERERRELQAREELIRKREERADALLERREQAVKEAEEALTSVAGLSREEATARLMERVEKQNESLLARRIKDGEKGAREESDRVARRIIATAIQRWAAEQVSETTVSIVNLTSDEMKGRIIGREGRNIRILESMTGVEFIIDDTPDAVVLSCFDPVRREVARLALEKLVSDGRIHPARIEEMVEKARLEIEERIVEEGEEALRQIGIGELHPELVRFLGRLSFRSSYGQNVLAHSIEVSFLAAQMAAEIGADVEVARRAGLLHDIGKVAVESTDGPIAVGPHALVGGRLCRKYEESEDVAHAVEAHHEDVEQRTVEAMLIQAADAISAARPGARRARQQTYVNRLENLEAIAERFEGVEQCYAIAAGREVRVLVRPEEIDDKGATLLARKIAMQIEEEVRFPGSIRVTVIRETRSFDVAR
jgi:ribonuclease Y